MMQNTPWARYDYGDPIAQPNDRWLTGQSLYVQYLAQSNALPQAQALSRQLADSAPGNQGLQIDYATVLQARGQPRAAERKLKMAEALEPANIELESQQAYVAMDLHEWHQLDVLTDDIIARRPKDRSAQKLARLRDIQHFSELRINAGKGLYSDNPISGTHDLSWDATLYSPRWRTTGAYLPVPALHRAILMRAKAPRVISSAVWSGDHVIFGARPNCPAITITAPASRAHASLQNIDQLTAGSLAAK